MSTKGSKLALCLQSAHIETRDIEMRGKEILRTVPDKKSLIELVTELLKVVFM